jgi:hypothetical protein
MQRRARSSCRRPRVFGQEHEPDRDTGTEHHKRRPQPPRGRGIRPDDRASGRVGEAGHHQYTRLVCRALDRLPRSFPGDGITAFQTKLTGERLPTVTINVTNETFWDFSWQDLLSQPPSSRVRRPRRGRRPFVLVHCPRVDACFYGRDITIMVQAHRDWHCGHDGRCIGEEERFVGVLHR